MEGLRRGILGGVSRHSATGRVRHQREILPYRRKGIYGPREIRLSTPRRAEEPFDPRPATAALKAMQAKAFGELLAYLDAADAVPLFVQRRRINTDAKLTRHDRHNTAADAAFGRDAHAIDPLPGVVIHTAGIHDAEQVFDIS